MKRQRSVPVSASNTTTFPLMLHGTTTTPSATHRRSSGVINASSRSTSQRMFPVAVSRAAAMPVDPEALSTARYTVRPRLPRAPARPASRAGHAAEPALLSRSQIQAAGGVLVKAVSASAMTPPTWATVPSDACQRCAHHQLDGKQRGGVLVGVRPEYEVAGDRRRSHTRARGRAVLSQRRSENSTNLDDGNTVFYSIGETPQRLYTKEITDTYKDYNDAALVVLTRIGGEGFDLPRPNEGCGRGAAGQRPLPAA